MRSHLLNTPAANPLAPREIRSKFGVMPGPTFKEEIWPVDNMPGMLSAVSLTARDALAFLSVTVHESRQDIRKSIVSALKGEERARWELVLMAAASITRQGACHRLNQEDEGETVALAIPGLGRVVRWPVSLILLEIASVLASASDQILVLAGKVPENSTAVALVECLCISVEIGERVGCGEKMGDEFKGRILDQFAELLARGDGL